MSIFYAIFFYLDPVIFKKRKEKSDDKTKYDTIKHFVLKLKSRNNYQ